MGGASSSSVKVAWDTSCLNPAPERVDLYLLSPEKAANLGQVTVWSNVPYSLGQFDVQLDSTLWDSTPSVDLQVQLIQAGTPVFLSQMAAGPVFKVVNPSPFTASASTAASNATVNSVTGGSKRRSHLSYRRIPYHIWQARPPPPQTPCPRATPSRISRNTIPPDFPTTGSAGGSSPQTSALPTS